MIALSEQIRRLVGTAVLILAIVAVAVLSAIDGRRIAGTGVAIAFPPPPQPGECVLSPLPPATGTGSSAVEIPVDQLRFGSCAGAIAGEIVGLRTAGSPPLHAQGSMADSCFGATAGFAGLLVSTRSAALPDVPPGGTVRWLPTIGASTYLVVPDDQARRGGQDWTACLATPTAEGSYRGSLRDAHTTGALPDQFGLCWAGTDLDAMPGLQQCDEPHVAELLATGWIPDRSAVSRSDIEASCVDIAGRIMRTADPTHQGTITIVLDPVRRDGATDLAAPLAVNCFATAAAAGHGVKLTHTVIGLAGGTVPLSG